MPKMAHEYLADLNAEQRDAVQHGIEAKSATMAPPLLVIAGAGSGKTKTLAHRVRSLPRHRGGPAPLPLCDVSPPSRRGDDPASEADHHERPRQSAGRSAVVRHVPCRWRSFATGIREPNRHQAVFHDS